MIDDVAIIIQARTGSSRFPKKVIKSFFESKNILEIIIEKLKKTDISKIIVATTQKKEDDIIVEVANKYDVLIYRGPEKDVLKRFILAAEYYNVSAILRVCADNPFIQYSSLLNLYEIYKNMNGNVDYISFLFNNDTPSIKTHFGFYGELVTLEALNAIDRVSNETYYHEHVTNYLYTHSKDFRIKYIKAPDIIYERDDIRLTIDTKDDFILVQSIYLGVGNKTIDDVIKYIDKNKIIINKMKNQINIQKK